MYVKTGVNNIKNCLGKQQFEIFKVAKRPKIKQEYQIELSTKCMKRFHT